MSKNIVLTGTYNSLNKGDAAMELTMASLAAEKGYNVTIASPFPELDKNIYKPIPVATSTRRRLIWGTIVVLRAFVWQMLRKKLNLNLKFLLNDEIELFINADLIIDLSGDMLTEDYGPHVTYSHFLPFFLAYSLQKPVFVCAQSIGPFSLTMPLAKWVLNRAAFITARDPITQEYLESLQLSHKREKLFADLAFLLKPAKETRGSEIFEKENFDTQGKSVLGVSLSPLVQGKYGKANSDKPNDFFITQMASMLDELSETLDMEVMFVAHVVGPGEGKDDRVIARKVAGKMWHNAKVIDGDYRPDELKAIISRCTMFIGARMHANIAALSSSIPIIAISYSHKTLGIMTLFKQDERVHKIEELDFDKLKAMAYNVYASRETISKEIALEMQKVKQDAERNMDIVDNLIQKRK